MAGTPGNVVAGPITSVTIGSDLGYTKGAVVVQPEVDQTWVTVDQECAPVDCNITTKAWLLTVPLAEATLANLAIAWDVTAASLHTLGKSPTSRTVVIVQPGVYGSAKYKTRTWTFVGCIATDYGEHSTEDGQPVVIVAKFKVLHATSGMSVAEVEV